jgi:hypothetical protein
MTGFIRSLDVRSSVIAGAWYPGGRQQLESTVDNLLARAHLPALPGAVKGLIAPHAGYSYSGGIAAHAYATVKGASYGTVVLLGPDHRGATGAYGVAACKFFQTPLGEVPIEAELLDGLSQRVALDRVAGDEEHSLEIQLPFLQRCLGSFSLLPVMMGYPLMAGYGAVAWKACQSLSQALIEVLAGRDDVLLVASTDLSHLYDYDEVTRYDKTFADLVQAFDPERLAKALMANTCHACGGAAVVTMMMVAKARGADKATLLAYTNSGDVTGSRRSGQYTVGYAAVALTASALAA